MGNCECTPTCRCMLADRQEVSSPVTIENDLEIKIKAVTPLRGKELVQGMVISNFVENCELKKLFSFKRKEKQERLAMQMKKVKGKVKNKEYFENKLKDYIHIAIRGKEHLFISCDELETYIHSSFKDLRKRIKHYYANEICTKYLNFYNTFLSCFKDVLQTEESTNRNEDNFGAFDGEGKENDKELNMSIIENDIENMYHICFDMDSRVIPMKLNDMDMKKKSCLLLMMSNEFDNNTNKLFLNKKISQFVRKFYYIYILKKYSYISKTSDFNLFSKKDIYAILTDEVYDFYCKDSSILNKYKSYIMKKQKRRVCFIDSPIQLPEESKDDGFIREPLIQKERKKNKMKTYNSIRDVTVNHNSNPNLKSYLHKFTKNIVRDEINNDFKLDAEHISAIEEKLKKNLYYKGEYDNTNFLFAGLGTLYKKYTNSIYQGTFRMGKKHGLGIQFKQVSDSYFKYYTGEWTNNTYDGYGFSFEIKKNAITIKKGLFERNHFISGEYYSFYENNNRILEIVKFEGNFKDDKYDSIGVLNKVSYGISKKTGQWEMLDEYDYKGMFREGKEEGQGESKKSLKTVGYSYSYQGNFENGLMNGYGVITYSDNYFIKKYEGFFNNDQTFYIYGIVYFKSGDIYEGFFEKYQKDYLGLYQHYEPLLDRVSDNFFGYFSKDKKDGFGRFIFEQQKKVMVGQYNYGEKNGMFEVIENFKRKGDDDYTHISEFTRTSTFSSLLAKSNNEGAKKTYYYFENNEILDKSERPFAMFT